MSEFECKKGHLMKSGECGLCGSCNERISAFKSNNLRDPLEYE